MNGGTTGVALRAATDRDLPAVAELERRLFGADAWSPSTVRRGLAGSARNTVVAEVDARMVGYAVTVVSGDTADLERIAVVPDSRRSGLATALLRAAVERASRAGAERLLLEVSTGNADARAFYAAQGFEEVARRPHYYRDGSAAVVLQRQLTGGRGNRG